MGHESGDMRVYCHEALHMKDKMQDAGYKPKIEKWDSRQNPPTASLLAITTVIFRGVVREQI